MKMNLIKITGILAFCVVIIGVSALAQSTSPVQIEFDEASKIIDMVTGKELPDYKFAERGSFQFFAGRLDEPEDFIRYFHDGKRTAQIKNLRSMEKFEKKFAQWRLRFTNRGESPQYIPRVYTLAVSFIPLNTSTKEKERRVYVLLDDLKKIDWEAEKNR